MARSKSAALYRGGDGELIGRLVSGEAGVVPTTVFGAPLVRRRPGRTRSRCCANVGWPASPSRGHTSGTTGRRSWSRSSPPTPTGCCWSRLPGAIRPLTLHSTSSTPRPTGSVPVADLSSAGARRSAGLRRGADRRDRGTGRDGASDGQPVALHREPSREPQTTRSLARRDPGRRARSARRCRDQSDKGPRPAHAAAQPASGQIGPSRPPARRAPRSWRWRSRLKPIGGWPRTTACGTGCKQSFRTIRLLK